MDWAEWLLKPTLGWVIGALLTFILMAVLKKKGSPWFAPILWGLIGAVLVLLCMAATRLLSIPGSLRVQPALITPDSVETDIRRWLDEFGLTVRKSLDTEHEGCLFALTITTKEGVVVTAYYPEDFPQYIILETNITLGEPYRNQFDALSPEQQERVRTRLAVELSRAKMGFDAPLTLDPIKLQKRVPTADGFPEHVFMQYFNDFELTILLTRYTLELELAEAARDQVQP